MHPKKSTTMNKNLFFVLIAAVSAVIMYLCWANGHAANGLDKVKANVARLDTPGKKLDDPEVKAVIAEINSAIAGKYSRVPPTFKSVFDDFKKAWGSKPLEADTIDTYRVKFNAQFEAYAHLKYNQALAIFLDWGIWMFVLGLCLYTKVLRDIVGDKSKIPKGKEPCYSLGRTQLVVWITIISSVYVYAILWDNQDLGIINNTALILMGISGGTFLAGAIVDTSEINQGTPRMQDLPSSGNFFYDILSDDQGVSIHRVQNFIWTLVAIVIYFYRYANPPHGEAPGLPVLDPTLLALTGISSLTYLTLKTRENPEPIDQVKIVLAVSPTSTLTPAEKAALVSGGFPGASVVVKDGSDKKSNATADATNPNFGFTVANGAGGNWMVSATWTGTPVPGGNSHTMVGKFNDQVTKATGTITINLA